MLVSIDSDIRARTSREFVAIDNGGLALRLLRFNTVDFVIIDVRGCTRAWLHTFGKELSSATPCLAVGVNPREVAELQSFLPTTKFVPTPVDWNEVTSVLEGNEEVEAAKDISGIVAVGLEDLLGLLAMTGAAARVQVSAGNNQGQLVVSGGIVLDATRGSRVGAEAAYEILSWSRPQVKSKPMENHDIDPTMEIPVTTLLCEAARQRDELMRLKSLATVKNIISRVAASPGFVSVVVTHVVNGETVVARGSHHAEVAAEALRHIAETADFWGPAAGEGTRLGSRGAVFWHENRVTITVPVTRQLVMTVVSQNVSSFAPLRNSVVAAAKSLADLTGPHVAAFEPSSAAAFHG